MPSYPQIEDPFDLVREVRRGDARDRMQPGTAGAIAGAIGGALMMGVTTVIFDWMRHDPNFAHGAGAAVLPGAERWMQVAAGFGMAVTVGAILGAIVAKATWRLRKFLPVFMWAAVVLTAVWTVLRAFVLPSVPRLAAALPYAPIVAAMFAFALGFALEVPLRAPRSRY